MGTSDRVSSARAIVWKIQLYVVIYITCSGKLLRHLSENVVDNRS